MVVSLVVFPLSGGFGRRGDVWRGAGDRPRCLGRRRDAGRTLNLLAP